MRHLTSHQAVADIAGFHKHIRRLRLRRPQNGSRSGELPWYDGGLLEITPAAPHSRRRVVERAVARPKVDMTEYNDRAGMALANGAVGGSDACQKIVVDGHAKIKDLLES